MSKEAPDEDQPADNMELFVQVLEKITKRYLKPVSLERLLEGY